MRSVAMRSCVASCSTLARSVPSSRSRELRRSLSSVVIALWMRAASRSAEPTSSSARRCAASSVLSASAAAVVLTSSASRRAVATSSATSFSARARSWPDGELGAGQGVGRLGVRLGHDVRGLLLGGPQQLLDARAQTGVRGPLGLAELAVRLGQLAGHLHGAAVEGLHLGAGVGESLLEPGDAGVDGFAFVSAEADDGEGGPGVGHEQSSWALWLRGAASVEALVDYRSPPVRIRVFTAPRTVRDAAGMHARADPSTRCPVRP